MVAWAHVVRRIRHLLHLPVYLQGGGAPVANVQPVRGAATLMVSLILTSFCVLAHIDLLHVFIHGVCLIRYEGYSSWSTYVNHTFTTPCFF